MGQTVGFEASRVAISRSQRIGRPPLRNNAMLKAQSDKPIATCNPGPRPSAGQNLIAEDRPAFFSMM